MSKFKVGDEVWTTINGSHDDKSIDFCFVKAFVKRVDERKSIYSPYVRMLYLVDYKGSDFLIEEKDLLPSKDEAIKFIIESLQGGNKDE